MNVTRSGLKPAKIINLETKKSVQFMFNPYEYTITKSNTWQENDTTGVDVPTLSFQRGSAQTLSLTLHFDTQATGNDVRLHTAPLWDMMMLADVSDATNKGAPPAVAFSWGKLYFKSVITSLSEKFTLFDDKGQPLRCEVTISLQQYVDAPWSQQSSSSSSPSTTTQVQGQRLDHVASQNGGSASNYREIAAKNNIDNPHNIPSGTSINL